MNKGKTIFQLLGLAVFIVFFIAGKINDSPIVSMSGILLWMAIWWMSEAVPLAITSLIPLAAFPLCNISGTKDVAPFYMNHIIFLFIGGFILAFAIEKWNLHKRIALKVIGILGDNVNHILLGFMLSSFFLSMWISNIATVMVMLPTALAVLSGLKNDKKNTSAIILLGIAYASSIGGTASLTGTAPNLICYNILETYFPNAHNVNFATWFMFGVPTSALMLFATYIYLKRFVSKNEKIKIEFENTEKISFEEKIIIGIFSVVALLWLTRNDIETGIIHFTGWGSIIPNGEYFNDATVVIFFTLFLFIIPTKDKQGYILEFEAVKKLPFDILLLFGGGFALAHGVETSGLSIYFGKILSSLGDLNIMIVVLIVTSVMIFLTEFTSNTATSQLILPILAAMSLATDINPIYILIPAAFAVSFAFMLPIATPPNTVMFGTGKIPMKMMVKIGIVLNFIGIAILTLSIMTWGKLVF